MAHVLIVDDEVSVREMVSDSLRFAGYRVSAACDAVEALNLVSKQRPDLLVVDINMPGMNGHELLQHLRKQGDATPVILLTARQAFEDVVDGLRSGADDYVRKPFRLEELLLRIEAVLRRAQPATDAQALRCGPLTLDPVAHTTALDGTAVDLSPTEFKLLEHLMRHSGRVVARKALLAEVWDMGFVDNATVLDTYVFYLRKKLHRDGFEPIQTVRGVGFRMVEPA